MTLMQKVERVTVTLIPTSEEKSFRSIPSTFSPANRTYGWKHHQSIDYMLVPRKVSHSEIKIDIFVDPTSKRKMSLAGLQKLVEDFVNAKIKKDWQGLKLESIGRPTAAEPPHKMLRRSTIEEIMGVQLEG